MADNYECDPAVDPSILDEQSDDSGNGNTAPPDLCEYDNESVPPFDDSSSTDTGNDGMESTATVPDDVPPSEVCEDDTELD